MALISIKTSEEFEEKVINSKKPVLVDFWAVWCPPCRVIAPILEKVAERMGDEADIVKLNIEESPDNGKLATEHRVQSIPNMVIFKDGKEVDRIIGVVPETEISARLMKFSKK